MVACRCEVLNGLSGDVAIDYVRTHLQHLRTDAMGRAVHVCPDTQLEWYEEREMGGYGENVLILRRAR